MISNSKKKLIRSLGRKKARDQQSLFIVEGEKMVRELLLAGQEGRYRVGELFATPGWIENNGSLLNNIDILVHDASEKELSAISNLVTPQPLIALVHIPEIIFIPGALREEIVLGLEAIRDPGNLGSIIRTADWFGIRHIVCSGDSVDLYNPKVVQSTMGSIARVSVYHTSIPELLGTPELQGKTVLGTYLSGENLYNAELGDKPVILFGNEARGLSPAMDSLVSKRISIPSFAIEQNGSESLNLAASVAVLCSEIRRRA